MEGSREDQPAPKARGRWRGRGDRPAAPVMAARNVCTRGAVMVFLTEHTTVINPLFDVLERQWTISIRASYLRAH